MRERPLRSYGSWPSPISIDMAVGAGRGLSEPRPDGADLYFLESRPDEAGRVVLMRRTPDGESRDVVPAELNVRTRVHEYGGGAYAVRDGRVVFSEFAANRLMLMAHPGAEPLALSSDPALRFADMDLDPQRGRVLAVLEDQRASAEEPRNVVCAVPLDGGVPIELAGGHDFCSDPRLSPDGGHLAWLTWDHPRMPWDGTDLWVADLAADGTLDGPVHVAGGASESIAQPTWAPDGSLVFASDRSGWWNLYRWRAGATGPAELAPVGAEFAGAQWVFGLHHFDVDADGTIVAACRSMGRASLLVLTPDLPSRDLEVEAWSIEDVRVHDGVVTYLAGGPTRPTGIDQLVLSTGVVTRVRDASPLEVDESWLSAPQHIEYPTSAGRTAYAWYYPPTNPDVEAPADERPPLVVMSHGGPTSEARTSLSLARQAFTSRGFAVVDVDYRGSTGYGRAYREQLRGAWGIVDVDDCTNVATWLVEQGLADPARLAIRGGSAGGFTTLAALVFRAVFAAGTSFFGVGDLEALARFTHKFESRYLDGLVAPYPQGAAVYRARSPVHHLDRCACPVLVMQGSDDKVVPQAQADAIVDALARKGLPHAYLLFEGEGHGFREAQNQRRALEAELSFYAQVFGFELADAIEPIEVVGLERGAGSGQRTTAGR